MHYPEQRLCLRAARLKHLLVIMGLLLFVACGSGNTPTATAPPASNSNTPTSIAALPRSGSPTIATTATTNPATASRPAASPTRTSSPATPRTAATPNPFGLTPGRGSSIDTIKLTEPVTVTFWHAQPPGVREQELQRLITGFQARYPQITIKSEYQGGTLFNKVRAAAIANSTPDLITATENQLTEYRTANLIAPLNDYVNSAQYGLSANDLRDFYPAYLTATIQQEQLLALPFAKSVLALYYNADKLQEAGVKVPETWDEFAATCKRFTGETKGYAININASSFLAAVSSRGGQALNTEQTAWRFNETAGVEQLALLQDLVTSGCAYLIEKQFADQSDFGAGRAVFTIDASSGFSYYRDLVAGGGKFNWGLAPLPHSSGVAPTTILSGSNLAILRSTPERQLATWLFLKYVTDTEATAGWAAATGYLPVRQSALTQPAMVQQINAQPGYRVAVTVLPQQALPEPTVQGVTEARKALEEALLLALTEPRRSPHELLDHAVEQANAALQVR